MNSNRPEHDDARLREILRMWTVNSVLPIGFKEQVWHRIGLAEVRAVPGLWDSFVVWLENLSVRPALAVSYILIALLVGLTAGYWHAQQTATELEHALGARYVQSVDPYQMPRN